MTAYLHISEWPVLVRIGAAGTVLLVAGIVLVEPLRAALDKSIFLVLPSKESDHEAREAKGGSAAFVLIAATVIGALGAVGVFAAFDIPLGGEALAVVSILYGGYLAMMWAQELDAIREAYLRWISARVEAAALEHLESCISIDGKLSAYNVRRLEEERTHQMARDEALHRGAQGTRQKDWRVEALERAIRSAHRLIKAQSALEQLQSANADQAVLPTGAPSPAENLEVDRAVAADLKARATQTKRLVREFNALRSVIMPSALGLTRADLGNMALSESLAVGHDNYREKDIYLLRRGADATWMRRPTKVLVRVFSGDPLIAGAETEEGSRWEPVEHGLASTLEAAYRELVLFVEEHPGFAPDTCAGSSPASAGAISQHGQWQPPTHA